jgi:hypothetical protein
MRKFKIFIKSACVFNTQVKSKLQIEAESLSKAVDVAEEIMNTKYGYQMWNIISTKEWNGKEWID